MPPSVAAARTRLVPKKRWSGSLVGRDEQHKLKRLAILQTAAKLFVERGYHETSLADIADSLHVTKPTLYYYVSSKEEMLAQISGAALAEGELLFQEPLERGTNGLDALRLFMRSYVRTMNSDFGRCLLAARHQRLSAETHERLTEGFRRVDTFARKLFERGIADGSIRDGDVRIATFVLYGAINWIPHWFHADGSLTPEEAGEAMFDVLAAGIAARRPARRAAGK